MGNDDLPAATLLFVPHSALGQLALNYPQIGLAFWRDGTVDATILAKWLVNQGRQDARGRLAHLLCEMGLRMEVAGLATRSLFELDATQEQLADALGLTSVHVNRTLQCLRREGLIATRSRMVEVLDWPALAAEADFDSQFLLLGEADRSFGSRAELDLSLQPPLG